MILSIFRSAIVAGLVSIAIAAPASAQERSCKPEITATGGGAIRESRSKEKAVDAWRQQAVANNGIFYGNEKDANDGKGVIVERCAKSLLGLTICQARARPCLVKQADKPNEIACTKDDSKNCEPDVKWIQQRLKDKGFNVTVDGSAGRSTGKAIRDFKKKNKLGDDDEITEKLLEALKG
jgi:hypothetical protein